MSPYQKYHREFECAVAHGRGSINVTGNSGDVTQRHGNTKISYQLQGLKLESETSSVGLGFSWTECCPKGKVFK